MDRTCQLNLELTETLYKSSHSTTLLHVIDQTLTPMGGRLLREWLKKPLVDVQKIGARQESIAELLSSPSLCVELSPLLKEVRDIERLLCKITTGYANPRDVGVFARSLGHIGPIKNLFRATRSPVLQKACEELVELPELCDELTRALVEEPPLRVSEGGIFRPGFNHELDQLRLLMQGGREWLAQYQNTLKEESGIKNLKVSFNKIFGYYIEVSKGQAHLIPPTFERRQTLVNCERFISPQLKEYETKVLTAEEKALSLEQNLFHDLRGKVATHEKAIFQTASAIAQIDVLLSLARLAQERKYCRPVVDGSSELLIMEGRHPVVEAVSNKEYFIPNDLSLDGDKERLMVISGPNMAGKSTFIRQVALIVILAQMGSFVPAKEARIGIVDQIFTRIGASDDLSRGQSTFMVEMSETAHILNNLTCRSLVILDEIGRGTSTYDGVAIAWSVGEYLLKSKAKTLFATHYWELTELEKRMEGACNYHAAVQEWNDDIIFLHKILKGSADRSYGIHVARLAGLPSTVIERAHSILKKLEIRKEQGRVAKKEAVDTQLSLF